MLLCLGPGKRKSIQNFFDDWDFYSFLLFLMTALGQGQMRKFHNRLLPLSKTCIYFIFDQMFVEQFSLCFPPPENLKQ